MSKVFRENQRIASLFQEAATLLEQQGANPFRIEAYRRAAKTLSRLKKNIRVVAEKEGIDGLSAIPTIGRGLSLAIIDILHRGRWPKLDRLRGESAPEELFMEIPGIGPKLARQIHEELHIDTLEALETTAHDGRLEKIVGIGKGRTALIKAALHQILGGLKGPWSERKRSSIGPSVEVLLDVDREYRNKASSKKLKTITPRRFNPQNRKWLPILHTDRGNWHFTVMYSNTARAHELRRTHDWVVIYFYNRDHEEGQCTVVTERRGPLAGVRVIRGREKECQAYYIQGQKDEKNDSRLVAVNN